MNLPLALAVLAIPSPRSSHRVRCSLDLPSLPLLRADPHDQALLDRPCFQSNQADLKILLNIKYILYTASEVITSDFNGLITN